MNKFLGAAGLVLATILTAGCHLEQTARDATTAGNSFILSTENQHPECAGGKTSPVICALIQDGIRTVNEATVDLDAYCEGTPAPGVVDYDHGGTCVPVKSAADVLKTALLNEQSAINAIKGVK